ncbi:MAG TPA: 1,4-dihydroxy-2-naphthoate polyprenyltransferase [Acidimicrobiales bacterium]
MAVKTWIGGARPRTLPAAVVPVAVGVACAVGVEPVIWWRAAAALVVALALQVATNYANDYSDGVKGTDTVRIGPVRLVAGGLASPNKVKTAALAAFGVAGAAGGALALAVGPEILVVGALAMLAGWFYTGGPKPYGYYGYGELFVFVFFGVVATAGTTYVLLERVTGLSLYVSVPVGFLACALLVVNNLRDIPTDTAAGKKTLAVRMGDRATRGLYVALVLAAHLMLPFLALFDRPAGAVALGTVLLARTPIQRVLEGVKGRDLIPVLGETGRVQLLFGALLTLGLVFVR